MPLSFTGNSAPVAETFEFSLEAFDGDKRVVVFASGDALDDHGLAAVEARASDKYDAGQVDPDGRVRVRTSDF